MERIGNLGEKGKIGEIEKMHAARFELARMRIHQILSLTP